MAHRQLCSDCGQLSTPWADTADRRLLFFGQGAFVEKKAAVRVTAQKTVSVQGLLIHQCAVLPGRMRREMLQCLIFCFRHHFGHPFHLFMHRLQQSTQVLAELSNHGTRFGDEEIFIALTEPTKPLGQLEQGSLMGTPCLLGFFGVRPCIFSPYNRRITHNFYNVNCI